MVSSAETTAENERRAKWEGCNKRRSKMRPLDVALYSLVLSCIFNFIECYQNKFYNAEKPVSNFLVLVTGMRCESSRGLFILIGVIPWCECHWSDWHRGSLSSV